jgi:hypothetical protein
MQGITQVKKYSLLHGRLHRRSRREIRPIDKVKLSRKLAPFSRDCGDFEPCVDHIAVVIRLLSGNFDRSF